MPSGQIDMSNLDLLLRDSQQAIPKIPINQITNARPNTLIVQGTHRSQISKSQRQIAPNGNTDTRTLTAEEQNIYFQFLNQQNVNSYIPPLTPQQKLDNALFTNDKQGFQQPRTQDLITLMGFDRKKEMHIIQSSNEPLRFGSVISLNPLDESMKFIMSDGFVKNKAYIKDLSYDGSGSIFDRCLFRVYPSFKSKYLRELLDKFQNMEKIKKNQVQSQLLFRKQTTESKYTVKKEKPEQQQQSEFEKNVMQEYKHNMDVFEKIKGTPVNYNQEIQLLHVASNTFLTCNYIESEIENENFGLELQQFSSKNTNFKIQACYSHQQRTEGIVQLKDIIYIVSAIKYLGRVPYLHSSKLKDEVLNKYLIEEQQQNNSFVDIKSDQIQMHKLATGTSVSVNVPQQIAEKGKQLNSNYLSLKKPTANTIGSQLIMNEDKNQEDIPRSYQDFYQNHPWQKSQHQALEQSAEVLPDPQTVNSINEDINMERYIQQQKQKNIGSALESQTVQQMNQKTFKKQFQSQTQGSIEKPMLYQKQGTQINLKDGSIANQLNKNTNISNIIPIKNYIQNEGGININNSTIQQKEKIVTTYQDKNNYSQEVNVSLEEKTRWRLISYSDQMENENYLQYGDVIWLNHIESGFTLITKKSEISYSIYVSIDSSSKKDQSSKYEGNTNGMWIIENENFTKGGIICWEDRFFLRHFSSGKYLSMNPHKMNSELTTFKAVEYPDVYSMFMFTPICTSNESRSFISKDSFFFIKSCYQNGWIHIKEKQEESSLYEKEYFESELVKGCLLLQMKYQQPLDEDAFKVIRATMTEVLEANFLISCFPILRSCLQSIQKLSGKELQIIQNPLELADVQKKLNILKICLQDLDKFCKNQIITTSIEHEASSYGKLNQSRQKVLAEQYYIDIVVALLKELLSESELNDITKIRIQEIRAKIASKIKICLHKQNSRIDLNAVEKQLDQKKKKFDKNARQNKQEADLFYTTVQSMNDRQRATHISFLKLKLSLVKVAYQLLTSICKQNSTNEKYLFDKKIKEIKYQAKYLKEAVDSIISIIGNNEKIVNDLCDDIRIAERKRRNNANQKTIFGLSYKQQGFQNEGSNFMSQNMGNHSIKGEKDLPTIFKQNNVLQNIEETLKMDNILIFFVNLVRNCPPEKRNPNFLKFFRTICSFKGKGVSVNQEIIYKFIENISGFDQSLLIDMKLNKDQNQMMIQFSESVKIPLDEQFAGKNQEVQINYKLRYLIQQIEFYSDLCLSRNYLWNNKMMQIFPLEYVIKQICDSSLHEQMRSAFCNLALSVYIDQEPLSEIILPQMCRVYNSSVSMKLQTISSDNFIVEFANKDNSFETKRQSFAQLLTFTIEYLENEVKTIQQKYDEMQNKINSASDNQSSKIRKSVISNMKYTMPLENNIIFDQDSIENRLSSVLTFNIVKMLITMIKLNVLTIMHKNDQYPLVIKNLVKLLEYDHNNYNISLSLSKKREERYEKQMNIILENKLIAGIKGIQKKLKEAAVGVVQQTTKYTQKTFKYVGLFMGISYKKRKIIEEEFSDYNENLFSSNPLVGGLVSLIQMIKKGDEEQNKDFKKFQTEISTKLEICEILLFMQNLRMDFLITNFLSWFDKLGKEDKLKQGNNQLENFKVLEQVIQDELSTAIPNVCKTGIEFIDLAYKPLEKKNIINIQLEKMWKSNELIQQRKRNKPKKFEIYTNQNDIFIPDLDTLITGKSDSIISSEILPSLLTTFYLVNESLLEDKILEVVFNQSNQTQNFFEHLQNLEILFEQKDILPFKILQSLIHKLRYLTERSEMWLQIYFQQAQMGIDENTELNDIIKVLNDIDALFFSSTTISPDGNLEVSQFFKEYQIQILKQTNPYSIQQIQEECNQELDMTRQKIFTFLQGYTPIINLIKDSQNQMAKFLKQQDVFAESKIKIVQLLRCLYSILIHFCFNIDQNQKILAKPEYLSFFLDEISIDYGQLDLLNAIYYNNKALCQSFPDSLFNQIKNAIHQFGRQPRFIQILKIIQSYQMQNQGLTLHLIDNQIRVFRWLMPTDYQDREDIKDYNYLLYGQLDDKRCLRFDLSLMIDQGDDDFEQEEDQDNLRSEIGMKNSSGQYFSKKNQIIDAPFFYHAILLDVFISSIEGDEGYNLNIEKIKNMFAINYIFKFLLKDDDFLAESPINLYYVNNSQKDNPCIVQDHFLQERSLYDKSMLFQVRSQEEGFSLLKPKSLILIKKAFLNPQSPHLETLLRELQSIIMLIKIENVRFRVAPLHREEFHIERYLEYFIDCYLGFCTAYLKAISCINDEIDEIKEREDISSLLELVQLLVARRSDLYNRSSAKQIGIIMEFIRVFFRQQDPDLLVQFKNVDSQVLPSPMKKLNFQNNAEIDIYLSQNSFEQIINEKEEQIPKLCWVSTNNWQLLLKMCSDSKIIQEQKENELSSLAEALLKVDHLYERKINFKDFLKKLILFVQQGVINKVQIVNMKNILKLLEKILELQDTKQKLIEMQNVFDQLDATKMVLTLISNIKENPFDDEELLLSLFSFMIKLLEGGNKKVQKTIYNFFINHPKSEVIFQTFHNILIEFIEQLKEKNKHEADIMQASQYNADKQNDDQKQKKKGINPLSQPSSPGLGPLKRGQSKKFENSPILINATSQDKSPSIQPQDTSSTNEEQMDNEKQSKLNSRLLIKLLQLLQLFCEGHNLLLQNYLRVQTQNRNSYDMITITVELLDQLKLKRGNYRNIVRCLDLLTEFIQGPCHQNQENIIDSKFLEIAQSILKTEIKYPKAVVDEENLQQTNLNQKNQAFRSDFQINLKEQQNSIILKNSKNDEIDLINIQSQGLLKQLRVYNKSIIEIEQDSDFKLNKQTKNSLEKWQVEHLKFKVMIVVNSLLELNKDPLVIKRVMRSLPLTVLKTNLAIIYRRYKNMYQDTYLKQSLNHADSEPTKNMTKAQKKYFELITETGFYIFFLISCYIELPSSNQGREGRLDQDLDMQTKFELSEIQKDFKESKGILYLQKNVIGQMTKFVYAILSGFYDYIKFITKKINLNKDIKQSKDEITSKYFKVGVQFFKRNSASIEIVRNNQIEKVRFIKLPFCHYLPKQTKQEFQDKVVRDSIHTKIQAVIDEYKIIIETCKHEEQLSQFFSKNKLVSIFANYVDMWRDIAFIITITLNIFIVISYSEQNVNKQKPDQVVVPVVNKDTLWEMRTMNPLLGLTDRYLTVYDTGDLFQLFGFIMIFCSMFVVVFFLVKKGPLYLQEAWLSNKKFLDSGSGIFMKILIYIFIIITTIIRVLINPEIIYYLSYGALAILATFVHPFFFAFHLTEFLLRYPTLRNILKSVYEPKKALILTFILILLVVYFFSVFAFWMFSDSYDGRCNSLYLCFFESFDKNYKANGGLGGWLDQNKSQNIHDYDYGRFFFDNLCNIFITILLTEMFSGIIIDKFGQLRDFELQKDMDVKEICFICGNSREIFDRKSDQGFQQHIKNDHYLWNYIFYLAYLGEKDSTELTGIESYIQEKLEQFDYTWFPIMRAAVLKDEEKRIQLEEQEFDDLQNQVVKYNNYLKEMSILSHTIQENVISHQVPKYNHKFTQ